MPFYPTAGHSSQYHEFLLHVSLSMGSRLRWNHVLHSINRNQDPISIGDIMNRVQTISSTLGFSVLKKNIRMMKTRTRISKIPYTRISTYTQKILHMSESLTVVAADAAAEQSVAVAVTGTEIRPQIVSIRVQDVT